jgi:hypothetical protein
MRRRFLVLTLALTAALSLVGEARAHRLKADCRFLPGRVVCVDTWFAETGERPKKGHVQVRGADGQVLLEGQLSRDGLFQFNAPEGQVLQIVVEAGEGHRASVEIRPEQVVVGPPADTAATAKDAPAGQATAAEPLAPVSHEEPVPVKDMLIGVGLVIAVAAFVLSLRNARALRDLRQSRDRGQPPSV